MTYLYRSTVSSQFLVYRKANDSFTMLKEADWCYVLPWEVSRRKRTVSLVVRLDPVVRSRGIALILYSFRLFAHSAYLMILVILSVLYFMSYDEESRITYEFWGVRHFG